MKKDFERILMYTLKKRNNYDIISINNNDLYQGDDIEQIMTLLFDVALYIVIKNQPLNNIKQINSFCNNLLYDYKHNKNDLYEYINTLMKKYNYKDKKLFIVFTEHGIDSYSDNLDDLTIVKYILCYIFKSMINYVNNDIILTLIEVGNSILNEIIDEESDN